MTRQPVVVVGIGNPFRTDDGIGPAIIELLDERIVTVNTSPGSVDYDTVQLDGEPTRVIEAWDQRRLAVICDAVCWGAQPGTVHEATIADLDGIAPPESPASSHAAGVAEAVALGQALGRMPDRLIVVGIEPASVAFGHRLTPEVAGSLGVVLDRILFLVNGDSANREPASRAQKSAS